MGAIKQYFKEQFQLRMLFLDHIKPSDFYLSCWQSTRSSVPLLLIRVLLFLTSLGIALYSSILYMKFGWFKFWFIYLTHWGLTLNTLATGFAVAVSARCHFYGPITSGTLPWYVRVYWLLFNIATPLAFLITIFYWTLLYNAGVEEELNHALDVCVHGVNSVVMFLLLLSSAQPARLLHAHQPLLLAVVYVVFGAVFYAAGGTDPFGNPYIYIVVDWANPGPTTALVAITGVLLIILYAVVVGVAGVRDLVAAKLMRKSEVVEEAGVPLRRRPQV
ncbi:unnamed protein product [Plutella xylostella]|uniref:(diamondback moth) hypothetical protein n=1 Tax=Plutella xylostella TaxID=51655 RepID=A0A8S4G6S0_PLUXY|nr:unnamed protein product [Plutella xylostella]